MSETMIEGRQSTDEGFGTMSEEEKLSKKEQADRERQRQRNKKRKEKKKRSKQNKQKIVEDDNKLLDEIDDADDEGDTQNDDEDVEIEYVTETPELALHDPNYFYFTKVFQAFKIGESVDKEAMRAEGDKKFDMVKEEQQETPTKAAIVERILQQEIEEKKEREQADDDTAKLSKRKMRLMLRPSIADLKASCPRPDVVEWHDVTAKDPKLLVTLKSIRNTVPVPRHWCFKRKYLAGKRGFERAPFELPDFIKRTGIQEMRQALQEKEEEKSLKTKMRERVRPKMGRIDIDYQKLHDAFFRWQSKPKMSIMGDLYFEMDCLMFRDLLQRSTVSATIFQARFEEHKANLFRYTVHPLAGDSLFSMVGAVLALLKARVYYVGTIGKNRGLDEEQISGRIVGINGVRRKMKRGEAKFFTDDEKKIQMVVWKDTGLVKMVSTVPELSTDMVTTSRKLEKLVDNRKVTTSEVISMPEILKEFNISKGGTDIFNQYVATNHTQMKTRFWPRPVFIWGIEASAVNCYILANLAEKDKWNSRSFRQCLINGLIKKGLAQLGRNDPQRPLGNQPIRHVNIWMGPNYKSNLIPRMRSPPRWFDMKNLRLNKKITHVCGRGNSLNLCIVHKQIKKTSIICMQCMVPLCLENCWYNWHNVMDYIFDDPLRQNVRSMRTTSTH